MNKKCKYFVFFILAALLFAAKMNAASLSAPNINKDSLLRTMTKQPSSIRLKHLDSLAHLHVQINVDKNYIEALLQEAKRFKNSYYEADALFMLGKYYYSGNPDSLRRYIKLAEPLLLKNNMKKEMFQMIEWNIYKLTEEGKNDSVLYEIEQMKRRAKQLNFQEGADWAIEALANFYASNGLKKEGLKLYEEAFSKLQKYHSYEKQIYLLRQLLNKEDETSKRIYYLNILNNIIKDCESKGITKLDDLNSIDFLKYLYHRTYAVVCFDQNNSKQMLAHIELAEQYNEKVSNDNNNNVTLIWLKMKYFMMTKDYNKALELADKTSAIFLKSNNKKSYADILKTKSDILDEQGKSHEALAVYKQYTSLKDSISAANYYTQLAQLTKQRDMDSLKIQNKQIELQSVKSNYKIRNLESGFLILLLLCLIALYIAYSRNKLSRQMKKARDKAEEADRLKSTFLANMNHEIRTPLNAIVGFSEVLVDEDDQETRKQCFGIIKKNNELLQRLIYDVLDLSRIESNSMQLIYSDTDLMSLMKDIYSTTILRMPENVTLELVPSKDILFYADPQRLTQILTNLLNNAIKHTKQGFIHFGYEIKSSEIYFFVQDSGEGIPEDKLDTIFGRFVQLNDMSKGVGLGLAICKGLVEQMKGTIGVTSTLGKGSTFYFNLPITKKKEP